MCREIQFKFFTITRTIIKNVFELGPTINGLLHSTRLRGLPYENFLFFIQVSVMDENLDGKH